jgi:hypothetical protein
MLVGSIEENRISQVFLKITHPVFTDAIHLRNRDILIAKLMCYGQKGMVFRAVQPYHTDTCTGR